MDELHRIHKDVPFGYWVEWIRPALAALRRKWRARHAAKSPRTASRDAASVRGQWV